MGCEIIGKSENNLHWCLDVLFADDECTVLDRNAAENLAIIRRIVYNRIKMLSKAGNVKLRENVLACMTTSLELKSCFHG